MDAINHLLAHQLSTNDALLHNLPHLKQLLAQRIIQQAEQEEGLNGPVLHRWNLRLASLIAPTVLAPLRTAGFELLHLTFSASTSSLLSQGKNTVALALNVITSNKSDPAIFVAALEVVRLILAKSTWHAEWAREVAGAAVVQRTVNALVAAANGQVEEVKPACLNAIVSLLPLFPTPLRPLAPSLHTLSIALISQPGASRANIDAGAQLFVSLYLLAPKGRDGLRDAWKRGAEALVGSIDSLVPLITSDIFAEDPLTNHTLAPLALPPLVDTSPVGALNRIEALSQALALLLRTPTVERVGAVEVPVGALVELGVRLVGLNTETPIKERVDPSTITLTLSLLPRLQIIGCQLLAQLGLAVGTPLVSHATEILGTISRTLSTYALRSPMRASLSTTYSLLLTSLGASLDPEEGKKSLARVWRCVLEDISAVAVEPVAVAASTEDGKGGGRKSKKQKTTYDPSESFEKKRAAVEEMDLAIAERALATLERLLLAPASHFLPPKLQLSTSRLLLFLALDPSFFSTHPLPSTSTSTFYPATSASSGVDIAKQSVGFRRGVVKALRALAEQGGNAAGGTLERAAEVWRRGCLDGDEEIKHLSITALSSLSSLIHPLLPPQQVNTTFARLKAERVGGFQGVGDDLDLEEGAREFAARVAKRGRGEGMEVDEDAEEEDEEDEEDEEVKRSLVAQTKATTLSSAGQDGQGEKMVIEEEQVSVVKPTSASSFGTAAGFASFAAVKKVETVVPAAAEDEEDSSDEEAEVPSFVQAIVPGVATGGASRGGDDDEEDSSDDEAMPTIHMDSDEE